MQKRESRQYHVLDKSITAALLILACIHSLFAEADSVANQTLIRYGSKRLHINPDSLQTWLSENTDGHQLLQNGYEDYGRKMKLNLPVTIGTGIIAVPCFTYLLAIGFSSDNPDFKMSENQEKIYYGSAACLLSSLAIGGIAHSFLFMPRKHERDFTRKFDQTARPTLKYNLSPAKKLIFSIMKPVGFFAATNGVLVTAIGGALYNSKHNTRAANFMQDNYFSAFLPAGITTIAFGSTLLTLSYQYQAREKEVRIFLKANGMTINYDY